MSNNTLKTLTLTLASGFTQVRLEISRILSGLYIRGSTKKSDYGDLVYTGNIRQKIPHAYGSDLDKLGYMFNIPRRFYEKDESYRSRILFAIRISATKSGIKNTLKFAFESSPFFKNSAFNIEVRESAYDYFDGVTTPTNSPTRDVSILGGLTIYISPKTQVQYMEDGKVIFDYYDNFVAKYGKDTSVPHFKYGKTFDHRRLLDNGEFNSLRDMLESIVAAGINIDRVVFQQPGASGNKGEYYAYEI